MDLQESYDKEYIKMRELISKTKTKKMSKVSECCGAEPILDSDDLGICPECKEHCEYVKNEEDE